MFQFCCGEHPSQNKCILAFQKVMFYLNTATPKSDGYQVHSITVRNFLEFFVPPESHLKSISARCSSGVETHIVFKVEGTLGYQ